MRIIYDKLDGIRQSLDDHLKALECYRKALDIREKLAKEIGTVESVDALTVSYYNFGSVVENERGKKYYQKTVNIWDDLRKTCPSVIKFENQYKIVIGEMNARKA